MHKIILVYGAISGAITIGAMILTMELGGGSLDMATMEVLGYLTLILALSLIFVGVKKYRDTVQGGVIRFATAFWVGLGITAVASIVYVAIWEAHLAVTDYAFIDSYTESVIAGRQAEGANEAEMAAVMAEMEDTRKLLENPLLRALITLSEIFPVGLLVTLVSAAVLRKHDVLPATG